MLLRKFVAQHMMKLKFLGVGILNTIFGYTIYLICLMLGLNYVYSISIATILGVLFNFKSLGVLVFNSSKKNIFWRFVFVYGLLYIFNVLGIKGLIFLGFSAAHSGLLLLVPHAGFSYLLNRRFVF